MLAQQVLLRTKPSLHLLVFFFQTGANYVAQASPKFTILFSLLNAGITDATNCTGLLFYFMRQGLYPNRPQTDYVAEDDDLELLIF